MISLENMNRQHTTILKEVQNIEEEINKGKLLINPVEIALHINRLAGQLKIHLLEEDKFLYPNLLNNGDRHVQRMAKQYIDEMGDLSIAYAEYKNKYNVGNKISENVDLFIQDTLKIMEAVKKRMTKENNELYQMIVEQKL